MRDEDVMTALPEAIRKRINTHPGDGCWIWLGGRAGPKRAEYASITIRKKTFRVHRYVFTVANGQIPGGLVLDHLCRTPLCVRPSHLEAVTPRVNFLRGYAPGANAIRTNHCKRGHEFIAENTYIRSDGGRECKSCSVMHGRSRTKGDPNNQDKTHCPYGHEYTTDNTMMTKKNQRKCRACGRIAGARAYAAKKERTRSDY